MVLQASLSPHVGTEALGRVLASNTFAKSARLSSFLRYVCETSLEGRASTLCEQHIGVAVFGRPEHYNPADDTIVRTTARLLRQRLTQYYESEGLQDQLRIAIPRGGYAPVFVPAMPAGLAVVPDAQALPGTNADAGPVSHSPQETGEAQETVLATTGPSPARGHPGASDIATAATATGAAAEPAPASRSLPDLNVRTPLRRPGRRTAILVSAGALLLAITVWCLLLYVPAQHPADRFWASLLAADRDTLLVVADNGLVMYYGETGSEVSLDDYMAKRLGPPDTPVDAASAARFQSRRYTAMSSVLFALELGKLAKAAPQRVHVRFARDLLFADLKRSNAIIVGIAQSNPWWELFRSQLNFHIDWDKPSGNLVVRNDHPLAGESGSYTFSRDDPQKHGFATIAYLPSPGGEGRTLLVGGTTSAGTEAAIEFLLNPARLQQLLKQVGGSDGSVDSFEVLLQCVLQLDGNTDIRLLGIRRLAR